MNTKKMKTLSLVMIALGVILTATGAISYFFSGDEQSNNNGNGNKSEEKIPKTPEEIAATWIGAYESDLGNSYYVIFENYEKAKILSLRFENDYMLPVSEISYKELKISSDKYTGTLKRNDNGFELTFDDNDESTTDNVEEVYKKVENSVWNGIYKKDNLNIFITQESNNFVYVNFFNKSNNVEHQATIFYLDESTENETGHYISDKELKYKTSEGDLFTITIDNKNINVKYSGDNQDYNDFSGTFKKYEF